MNQSFSSCKGCGFSIGKSKRMVECGHDVVILLDSITRLAGSLQYSTTNIGKVLSGGVDTNTYINQKIFWSRKIEDGGSLTILATALQKLEVKWMRLSLKNLKELEIWNFN